MSLRCAALVSPGYSGVLLLAPTAELFPGIWGPLILISMLAEPVYSPTSKGSFLSQSPPAFLSFVFLMTAVLTGVRWNHSIVLICISDGEGGWTFVFPVYRPFVFCIWKTLCNYTVHLLTEKLDGLLLRFLNFFVYSRCESSIRWDASKDVLLHSVGGPFTRLLPLLCGRFSCHEIPLVSRWCHFLRDWFLFRQPSPTPTSWSAFPWVVSDFQVLTLRSLTQVELVLYRVRDKGLASSFYTKLSGFPSTSCLRYYLRKKKYVWGIFAKTQVSAAA